MTAVALLLAIPGAAAAADPTHRDEAAPSDAVRTSGGGRTSTVGYDISYPQCGGPFPSAGAFRIVGVNGGRVFSPNPCLGTGAGPSELAWAGMHAQLYANTGNPGPELSSRWPHGQTFPRPCNTSESPGPDTVDCAYDYGWNAAADSYRIAVEAYVSLGWAPAGATRTPVANRWWLDVETANSWRSDAALNVAALQGATDYLLSVDVASVGFYSTQYQWNVITGGTMTFSDHRSWVAGARNLRHARQKCSGSGFTGGGVALVQFPADGFDADHRC